MRRSRPGSVLPTLGVCLIALFGFVALAVDLGMLAVSRTQCQNAADAAALVGARNLHNREGVADTNRADALAKARAAVKANPNLNKYLGDAEIASVVAGQYSYDSASQRFRVSYPAAIGASDSWSAVRVELAAAQPTYFMRVMGVSSMPTGAAATAVHRPRDIAFVLDFTGSMAFASESNWPYSSTAALTVEGLLNPDPDYPKFGHYSRYTWYQSSNTAATGPASSVTGDRPNPLRMNGTYTNSDGTHYPNNQTVATSGGPPVVEDFQTAPGDPPTVNAATLRQNAFKMWDSGSGSYNALTAACPAPANFDVQSDLPTAYFGDKWPRTDGGRGGSGTWSTLAANTFADNGAKTLKEFLGYAAAAPRDLTNYTLPNGTSATTLLPAPNTQDGGTVDANLYDAIWEKYGYDLDVSFLRAQSLFTNKTVKVTAGTFQGCSMGPGYWGKTFFIWPPDPRFDSSANLTSPNPASPAFDANGKPMCDWRRRFFLRGDGQPFNPQTDDINAILFATTAGHTLNPVKTSVTSGFTASNCPGYFRLNYPAIIAWLKSGPQTLPTNLRSGRILYYSSIPSNVTTSGPGNADDRTFWREYIHFIFGVDVFDAANAPLCTWGYPPTVGYPAHRMMAGVESRFPFGTLTVSPTSAYSPAGGTANPKPYMNYADNVNRPRMHFWFGPATMLQFLKLAGEDRPWWSGTTHESQAWQLKVAVNSVLDDIKRNHPNDNVGLAGFSTGGDFSTPLAPTGQDYFTLKNVLFFRRDTVAALKTDPSSTLEHRPYDSGFLNDVKAIPNSKGGTDANSGLALAFNLLSSSPTLLASGSYGAGGRKGASKTVVFETDGRPQSKGKWVLNGTGADTRYELGSSTKVESWTKDSQLLGGGGFNGQYGVKVVERIVAPVSTTGTSGFSLPNAPARVYAIAFGDIFNGYDDGTIGQEGTDALRFLLRVQQVGNTSPGTVGTADPPSARIPAEQIITGSYDVRISKMKSALERIAQSGVQVTLVE
ncbi:MAG: pilus assembly protein TadG-related protein [Gemmataceae bacterium]